MCGLENSQPEPSTIDLQPQEGFIFPYICPFGNVIIGLTDIENLEKCSSCNDSYELENSRCVQDCTMDDIVTKLEETPSNVFGCNANSINRVDILELASLFSLSELEAAFSFEILNENIDEIYTILVARAETVARTETPFVSVCYRTVEVQTVIMDILNVFACKDITAGDLMGFTGILSLSEMDVTFLKRIDLLGLTMLNVLELDHNRIETLPNGLFDDLGMLNALALNNNLLLVLPDDVFAPLASLENLTLLDNELECTNDNYTLWEFLII